MRNHTIEETVLQDAWLRRVARALVQDEHAAEDLAQDGWVVALQRRRTHALDRPWLGGVLRHRAFSGRRKAASRTEREQQAAQKGPAKATDEVAAQLQLRELVTHELGKLNEPYRTAVYLHVVEGLPLRKVAGELDVAASTAHSHVNVGLERLRKRLDGAYGGDRRAWLGLMVPWGNATAPSTAWFAGWGWLAGGIVLSASVIGGTVMGIGSSPSANQDPVEGPMSPAIAMTNESIGPVEAESNRGALAAVATGPAPAEPTKLPPTAMVGSVTQEGVLIHGWIRRPGGAPGEGTTWKLRASSGNQVLVDAHGVPSDWEDLEGVVSADGKLDLNFNPHPSQQYRLTLDHPSFVPMTWRWFSLKEGDVEDLGEVTLQAPGRLQGRLMDPSGEPLGFRTWRIQATTVGDAAAEGLQPHAASVKTDSEAGFVFERLPEGPVQLHLQDRNLGRTRGPLAEVLAGEQSHVEFPFTLPEGMRGKAILTCHVMIKALVGPVVPGQLTLVGPDGVRLHATRDPEFPDAYVFHGLSDDEYRLEVDDPRLTTLGASKATRGQSLQCLLLGSATAMLTVTGPDGTPIDDFAVEVALQLPGDQARTTTVRRGGSMLKEGRLMGLPPGDYELTVKSGHLAGSTHVLGLSAGETRSVAVSLEPVSVLSGHVRRPDGSPAAKELVRLVTPAPENDRPGLRILDGRFRSSVPNWFRQQIAMTVTDMDGRYTLPVSEHPFLIVVAGDFPGPMSESPAFRPAPLAATGTSPEFLNLLLPAAAQLDGRIIVPENTNLTEWRVYFEPLEGGDSATIAVGLVGPDGRFSLDRIHPGEGRLLLELARTKATAMSLPGSVSSGRHLLGTLSFASGEKKTAEYDYPGEALVRVQIAVAGAGGGNDDHSAFMARDAGGPVGLAAAKGPEIGPFRLEPGTHSAWLAGDNWVARVQGIQVPAADGATVPVPLELIGQRVRVMIDGAPLVSHRLDFMDAPSGLTLPQLKTDAEGFLDLRMNAGTYALYPAQASQPEHLNFKAATFDWPLQSGQTVLTLQDIFAQGW